MLYIHNYHVYEFLKKSQWKYELFFKILILIQ